MGVMKMHSFLFLLYLYYMAGGGVNVLKISKKIVDKK